MNKDYALKPGILSNAPSPLSKSTDLRWFAKISCSIRSRARATATRGERFGNLRNMHRQICRSLPRCFLPFSLSFSLRSQRVISRPPSADTGARRLACVCCRGAASERGALPPPLSVATRSHPPRARISSSSSSSSALRFALCRPPSRSCLVTRGEGVARETSAMRERATGWWKSGRSQTRPRPDRGQRTPTRCGTRGCPSVRHRCGSRGPTGVALLVVRQRNGTRHG